MVTLSGGQVSRFLPLNLQEKIAPTDFIQARRENHEVFSLVDERRALPLAFNILTDSLLTGISNGTAEVSITPKCSLLPESSFQLVFVLLPKLNRRFAASVCAQLLMGISSVRFSPDSEYCKCSACAGDAYLSAVTTKRIRPHLDRVQKAC